MQLEPNVMPTEAVRNRLKEKRIAQKLYYDHGTGSRIQLREGQQAYMQFKRKWMPVTVERYAEPHNNTG